MAENYKKLTLAPYRTLVFSVHQMVGIAVLLLVPQIVMLFVTHSSQSLVLMSVVVAAGLLADVLDCVLSKKTYSFPLIALYQSIIIAFFLPSGYPLLLAFFVVFATLLVDRYAFGGFAQSWANSAVVAVCILYFLGSQYFPPFVLSPEYMQSTNAGASLFSEGILEPASFDSGITAILNDTIFSKFGVSIPSGYITLFWDTGSSIPAFRFNLFTLGASLFLLTAKIVDGIIPALFLLVYGLLVWFFGLLPYGDLLGGGDVLLALLSSGTLFAAFFLLEWFGTHPQSMSGKFVYGILSGVIAFLIAGCGTSPVGIVFSILVITIFSPCIQKVESNFYLLQIKKRLGENSRSVGDE